MSEKRTPILAFAWELVPGDLVVEPWEDTSAEVKSVDVQDRQVIVHWTKDEPLTVTRQPGREPVLDVQRLTSLLPPMDEPQPIPEPEPAE